MASKIVLAYKNFAANKNISHIGLGVAALNTAKTLIANGYDVEVWPILSGQDLQTRLLAQNNAPKPISHVVISAPWIPTITLNALCMQFTQITFAVNCHSNVGFLQADPNGVKLLREYLNLEMAVPNFRVSANSWKMSRWVTDAYGNPCLTLPNLYYLDSTTDTRTQRRQTNRNAFIPGGPLRLGLFGACRPQKNFVSAVGAALEISYQNPNRDLDLNWPDGGRRPNHSQCRSGTL